MQKILKIEWIQMNSSIEKELPQFLSDQKLEIISGSLNAWKKLLFKPKKYPKNVVTIFYQMKPTPLSLFSCYPKFGTALKFLKQEKEKSSNYDEPDGNAVEWVYEN